MIKHSFFKFDIEEGIVWYLFDTKVSEMIDRNKIAELYQMASVKSSI